MLRQYRERDDDAESRGGGDEQDPGATSQPLPVVGAGHGRLRSHVRVRPAAIVALRERHDRADPTDAAESNDPMLANDPAQNADRADPTDPMDSTEPIDPIDSTDPVLPIDRIEHSER
jgi:hypothetical protein